MVETQVVLLDRLELRVVPRRWIFADQRRVEIDAHFAARCQTQPLWNGRVLLLHEFSISADVFRGAYLETDFASFLAWRDWGCPDAAIRNCFSLGAVRGADGAFLLGVMADHTANAGKIYFPGGTPDPTDVAGDTVDLYGSVIRELAEETGLAVDLMQVQPGWYAVLAGARIAMIKLLQSPLPAAELRARVLVHLAQESSPELADIRIVGTPDQFDPLMPAFVTAFLRYIWQ